MIAEDIVAFERDIAERFNRGEIRAPIHLDGGNEEQLVSVFEYINREDWVCGTWRMHGKCLLHGVPPDLLREDIIAGKSITLNYPEYRIVSSAIVGGILPIAMGISWEIKRTGGKNKVHCFLGDMCSESGTFYECAKYSEYHDLPIRFIVEDNHRSVCSDTRKTWNCKILQCESEFTRPPNVEYYKYELPWPHAGSGTRVQF